MKILSLEDVGYRRLCPRQWDKAEGLKATLLSAGYEVVEGDEFILCKPLAGTKEFISLTASLSKDNFTHWSEILDSLQFFYNPDYKPTQDTYVKDSDVEGFLEDFLQRQMPDSLHSLRGLLAMSHCKQLRSVLRRTADKFFEKYANGRLHFICVSNELGKMEAVTRVLTAVDAFGAKEFTDLTLPGGPPPQILTRIHPSGIEPITEDILKSLLSCFFRFTYGAVVGRLGGYIVIQFDPPVGLEPPYSRTRWDFNRVQGMFEPETGFDVMEYLRTGDVRDQKYQLAFRRYIFERPWSADAFESLFRWTIDRINVFWTLALDLCNYTTRNGFVDFLKHKKLFLTLERTLVEINYIFTEMDPFVRKILYFNLHDKIATLSGPVASMSKRRRIFNRLLKPSHYKKALRGRLRILPNPFDSAIPELGDSLFQQVTDACLKSVWARHRMSEKGVWIRKPVGDMEGWITQRMQDHSEGPYVPESFSANLLHEIRNSLHGYLLHGGNFERFMLMHSGDIPDTLPDLAIIWFFLFLADAEGLLSGDWGRGQPPGES